MNLGKKLFKKPANLGASLILLQEDIQFVIAEELTQFHNILVDVQEEKIIVSAYLPVTRLGIKRYQYLSISLYPYKIEPYKIHFNLFDVLPIDDEEFKIRFLNYFSYLTYNDQVLTLHLESFRPLRNSPYGLLRHIRLCKGTILVGLGN